MNDFTLDNLNRDHLEQGLGKRLRSLCLVQNPETSLEQRMNSSFISIKEILSDEPPLPEAAGPELDVWPPVDLCAGEKSPASTSKSLRHDSGSR